MSTLLEQASLVMIPSGYKEDVVYSQIPTSGAGDLSFTRASNGTRINSAGLVEVCPWNLLQYSEDLSNSAWTKENATITANDTTAPNGTTTADLITSTSTSFSDIIQSTSQIAGQQYTFSCYGKKGNSDWIILRLTFADGAPFVWFNLNSGTIGTINSGLTASIESVGNGWYRCSITGVASATPPASRIDVWLANANSSFSPNIGNSAYIWGAQLNIGSTAKPYFPTTDRLNVPRLTYQNGGGGCPSLLLEKQSTNLITYSEDISNSFSSKVGVTITSNNTTSPDGTQNADLLKFDTTTAYVLRNQTVNALTTYTMSVFVKNNNFTSGQQLTFNMSDGVIGGLTAQINVVAKTATFSASAGAFTSVSGKVEDYENGWFRVSVTGTSVSGGGGWYEMAASNVTNSCFVWGLSLEQSSYPTSYIPTTTSSATRVADACFKTGISSLIGQTEGVIYIDVLASAQNVPGLTYGFFYLFGDATNNIQLYYISGILYIYVVASSSVVINSSASQTITANTRYKMAMAYKSGQYALYVNGTQILVNTSSAVPAMSQFNFNATGFGALAAETANNYNEFILFKTRLTNAELASITTL